MYQNHYISAFPKIVISSYATNLSNQKEGEEATKNCKKVETLGKAVCYFLTFRGNEWFVGGNFDHILLSCSVNILKLHSGNFDWLGEEYISDTCGIMSFKG